MSTSVVVVVVMVVVVVWFTDDAAIATLVETLRLLVKRLIAVLHQVAAHKCDIVGMPTDDGASFELREQIIRRELQIGIKLIEPLGEILFHGLNVITLRLEWLERFGFKRMEGIAVEHLRWRCGCR